MNRFVAAAAVALCAACAACAGRVHSAESPVPRAVPFDVSSIGGNYGIQVRLDGTLTLRDGWVDVDVPTAALRYYQRDPAQYRDVRVRAAVFACPAGSAAAAQSHSLPVDPTLLIKSGGARLVDSVTYPLSGTIHLSVPVPRAANLERAWIAFVVEWPFENAFATYAVHTNVPLAALRIGGPPIANWDAKTNLAVETRCR